MPRRRPTVESWGDESLGWHVVWVLVVAAVVGVSGAAGPGPNCRYVQSEVPGDAPPQDCDQCEWQARAHHFQRALAWEIPAPLLSWPGTHNSFNNWSRTSLAIEHPHNHYFSIDDQVRIFHSRQIEFDPHFVEDLPTGPGGDETFKLRVCHMAFSSSRAISQVCSKINWVPCKALNIADLGNDTGCNLGSPLLSESLRPVVEFADAAREAGRIDLMLVYFDTFFDGRTDLLDRVVEETGLASHVFSPADWTNFTGVPLDLASLAFQAVPRDHPLLDMSLWPSVRVMVERYDRRVLTFSSVNGSVFAPSAYTFPNEMRTKFSLKKEFQPRNCSGLIGTGHWPFQYVQGDATKYLLFGLVLDNSLRGINLMSAQNVSDMLACGFAPYFDQLNSSHSSHAVWSWRRPYPLPAPAAAGKGGDEVCAVFAEVDGRMVEAESCSTARAFACQREQPDGAGVSPGAFDRLALIDWVVTGFGPHAAPVCPPGYTFSVPHTSLEATTLRAAVRAANRTKAWVNLKSAGQKNGDRCWSADGGPPACYDADALPGDLCCSVCSGVGQVAPAWLLSTLLAALAWIGLSRVVGL